MSSRTNAAVAVLAVALLLSVAASVALLSSNAQLDQDKATASTRLRMNSILDGGQMAVQAEMQKIRDLVVGLALTLRSTGLNSTEARAEMNATVAADPYIIDIITVDTHGVVLAAEPEQYRGIEGVNLTGDAKTDEWLLYKVPVMIDTFLAYEGVYGSGYGCSVFAEDGSFLGGVSILYSAAAMLNGTLLPLSAGTGFTWWCMQTNGTLVYDTDAAQIGLNQLVGPEYVAYPELVAVSWKMVNESSGYGVYHFLRTLDSGQTITKEIFWNTVGAEGIEWRLAVVHWV